MLRNFKKNRYAKRLGVIFLTTSLFISGCGHILLNIYCISHETIFWHFPLIPIDIYHNPT